MKYDIDKIQLRNDWVLLEIEKYSNYGEESGLAVPVYKKYKEYCTVLKVGPGRKNKKGEVIPLCVKPGDKVYISNPAIATIIGEDGNKVYGLFPEPFIDLKYFEENER